MITYSKIMKYVIVVYLLLDNAFFNLVPIPSSLTNYMSFFNKTLIGVIASVLFLLCLCGRRFVNWLTLHDKFLLRYCFLVLCAVTATVALTCLFYRQMKPSFAFTIGCHYYIPLMAVPIMFSLQNDENTESLFRLLNIFAIIWYVILIAQNFIFEHSGKVFVQYMIGGDMYSLVRNGRLRGDLSPFGNFMIVYNFYMIIAKSSWKKKILNIIGVALGLFASLYVQQSRAYEAITFGLMAIILLIAAPTQHKKIRNVAILAVGGLAFLGSGVLERFMATFSDSSELSNSGLAREYAVEHFLSVFKSNPLIGYGFAGGPSYDNLVHGTKNLAYADDVGIYGQIGKLGLMFFIMAVPLICRMVYICWQMYKRRRQEAKLLVVALAYVLMTGYTLMIYDNARIVLLPFLIVLFEFEYRKQLDAEAAIEKPRTDLNERPRLVDTGAARNAARERLTALSDRSHMVDTKEKKTAARERLSDLTRRRRLINTKPKEKL